MGESENKIYLRVNMVKHEFHTQTKSNVVKLSILK